VKERRRNERGRKNALSHFPSKKKRKATSIPFSLSFFSLSKKMSGRPTDHLEPAAKKRGSDRQLTKNDVGDSDDESGGEEVCLDLRAPCYWKNGWRRKSFVSDSARLFLSLRDFSSTMQRRHMLASS